MTVITVHTKQYDDQKPGTSGLRKRVSVFQQDHYLENFVQCIFDSAPELSGGVLVLGGDGRYHNDVAVQTIIQMASANGVYKILVGQNGLLSTPAVSHLIRKYGAQGGIVLSASHNPGGPKGDFGIKYNVENGGPAPESVTAEIFERSQNIREYKINPDITVDLSQIGITLHDETEVHIVDPVRDYADFMEELFDFDKIRSWISSGKTLLFDAMHAVTGPYAKEILIKRLGAPAASVINAEPSPTFAGGHPDPNPVYAKELFDIMLSPEGPDFGAASDGDGDRNIVLGRGVYVSPSDSLAVITANAHLAPGYKDGISGVARSMPTSRASDVVARKMGIEYFETPTGWKFFGNLLDAGRIAICGEESAGTSSHHVREKDGLWAILMWMNILAERGQSVAEILSAHWAEYGRHYYSRHDYEAVEKDKAEAVMARVIEQLSALPGQSYHGEIIAEADSFTYHDPVDGSTSANQGLRVNFESGSRFVLRLSGTGTVGATLRLYLERYEPADGDHQKDVQQALAHIAMIADEIANIAELTGRDAPDIIS